MKRLLISLVVIGIVTSVTIGLTRSFFSDTETSSGNLFQAGAIDLKIDNTSYYNGKLWPETTWALSDLTDQLFFNFKDIKPNDWGEDTVSLHVDNNDAWACVDFTITKNDDNTCTEPELIDDPSCDQPNDDEFDGELADNLNFVFWIDDGDNVLEVDEYENRILTAGPASGILGGIKWVLADSLENNIGGNPGDPLVGLETYYIGKAWCFGELTLEPLSQDQLGPESTRTPANSTGGVSCDGSQLDNATQTDVLMGDIQFYAEQYRHNPDFVCEECFQTVYANSVESSAQGLRKNGTAVDLNRSDPLDVLGAPDGIGSPPSGFFSLGFGGSITVKFGQPVQNGGGDDLGFIEITNGRDSYPEELAQVEVSQDGSTWFTLLEEASSKSNEGGAGVSLLEISPSGFSEIQYVRVTDTSDSSIHDATADGFDLDAISAVYGSCEEPQ